MTSRGDAGRLFVALVVLVLVLLLKLAFVVLRLPRRLGIPLGLRFSIGLDRLEAWKRDNGL